MERPTAILSIVGGTIAAVSLIGAAVAIPNQSNDGPRMEGMKVSGLAGLNVRDANGEDVGRVLGTDTDASGHTRYVRIALTGGEEVRVAAFRAFYEKKERRIDLSVPVVAVLNDRTALVPHEPKITVAAATPGTAR